MWNGAPKRLVLLGVLVAVSYFAFAAVTNGLQTHNLQQQEAAVQSEVDRLLDQYRRMSALEDYMDSDEYIELVAREQLGLVRSGETAIAVTPVGGEADAPTTASPGGWWNSLTSR